MPAKSQAQQKLMGLVHAIQQGKAAPSGEAGEMAKSMKPGDVEDFASTSRKGLPAHVEEGDPAQMAAEAISKYNEYGKHFHSAMTMGELAEKLMQVAEFAEQSVMSEADDWFDGHTIKRNMKEMKSYVSEFAKVAQEHDGLRQRMSALYDDMGRVLERYFEIHGDEGAQVDGNEDVQEEGDIEDNMGLDASHELEYDTGEDHIDIGNSNKNPVPPAHAAQMAHEDEDGNANVPDDGRTSGMTGHMDAGQEDFGEPHDMDDPTEFDNQADRQRMRDEDRAENQYPSLRDGSALEMDEGGEKFQHLTHQLSGKGAHNPKALAAWIGRKKYGPSKFSKMAHETVDEDAGLKRAKNLTERIVRLAREQLKGDKLVRFDTLPREIQIRAAWKLIR